MTYRFIIVTFFGLFCLSDHCRASLSENIFEDDIFSYSIFKKISSHIEEFNSLLDLSSKSMLENSFDSYIKKKLLSKINPLVQFKKIGIQKTYSSFKNTDYELYFGSFLLCDFYFNAHQFQNQSLYLYGKMPRNIKSQERGFEEWPDESIYTFNLVQFLAEKKNIFVSEDDLNFVSKKKCLYFDSENLIPSLEMVFKIGERSFRSIVGEEDVFYIHKYDFDATGIAKVYEKNPIDGKIADISIDVDESGNLTNNIFTTITNGVERAKESDFIFEYEPTDQRFSEALNFAHVNQHLKWFEKYGYQWLGPSPLELNLHGSEDGSTIQVYYQPGSATQNGVPTIRICDGDGVRLQNLTLDADVVSHELGHHIVFSRVTNAKDGSEALLIHEGLSDYFVFSRTGDSCLGESICPKDSKFCWLPEKCLRTADNTILYNDEEYVKFGTSKKYHLQGQVISGFLWELSKKYEIPFDHLNKLVIYTVLNLLGKESGFRDLLIGLINADIALSGGKYACLIQEKTEARNLAGFVAGVSCYPPVSEKSSKKKNDFEKIFGCGVIKKASKTERASALFVFMLLPVLLAIISRFRVTLRQK